MPDEKQPTDSYQPANSNLTSGYTTGTCAAAAARAAVMILAGDLPPEEVTIVLPDGDPVRMDIHSADGDADQARAVVRKDAGDDPDVTDGALVVVAAEWNEDADGIAMRAGEGVGVVTRPGLQVNPGEPAINPVPRQMIRAAVREVTDRPVILTVSVPGGEELAEETFNPRLGIEGGISILGTTGRVRPFSCPALRQSLSCSIDMAIAASIKNPILVPGHVGERAARKHLEVTSEEQIIPVSNEWGYMLDRVAEHNFDRFVAVGHPGKMAKLAAGHWDTHSSNSPSAVPIVMDIARRHDVPAEEHNTTEGMFGALNELHRRTLGNALAEQVRVALDGRTGGTMDPAVILVNMEADVLGRAGIDINSSRS